MSGVISPDLGLAAPGGASFNPLKRRNTQIPEQAAAEHPTPTSATTGHGTTYRMDPMMTEHLALIGFAARLGTSLTSDAAEASATRNDAQLLMGMLSSRHGHKPTSSDECAGRPPLDEAYCAGSTTNTDAPSFAFSCPSLSLDANHQRAKRTMTAATGRLVLDAAKDDDIRGSDLLGRTLLAHSREGVSEATDVMARNALQAFSVALEWRYSAWVGSLAEVLRIKKSLMAQQQQQQQGEGDVTDGAASFDEEEDDGYDYAEATAIDYLARTIADLSVIDVKTAFRVQQPSDRDLVQPKKRIKVRQVTLENTHNNDGGNDSGNSNGSGRLYERSSPLIFEAVLTVLAGPNAEPMRVVLGTAGTIAGTFAAAPAGAEGEEVLVGVDLRLDTDGLAHSMEEQSRLLVRAAAEAAMGGGATPSFHATLPAMANAPTRILDLTQPPSVAEEEHATTVVPPNRQQQRQQYSPAVASPKAVVITPRQGNSPSSPFSSPGGAIVDRTGAEDGFTISLPVAGTPLPPSASAPATPKPTVTPTKMPSLPPKTTSPSMTRLVSESSTATANTHGPPASKTTFLTSPKPTTRDPASLPKLVSPSPVQLSKASASGSGAGPDARETADSSSAHSDSEDSGPRAIDSEWYTYQRKGTIDDTKKEGPKLPALLEACAAISSTKA